MGTLAPPIGLTWIHPLTSLSSVLQAGNKKKWVPSLDNAEDHEAQWIEDWTV